MAYTKHTWENGEIITAEKLNNLEDGVDGSSGGSVVFNVNSSYDEQNNEVVLGKTWQEIYDASKNGALVVVLHDMEDTGFMYSGKEIVYQTSYEANAVPKYRIYTFHISDDAAQVITRYGCASSTDFPYEWHNN